VFSVRAASRLYNEDLRQLRDKINWWSLLTWQSKMFEKKW
jgi:hypothetical protein